jgi:hypothetical protein
LLLLRSSFWLGQWFLQMPQPTIVVITATIVIAKFLTIGEKIPALCRVFFCAEGFICGQRFPA